MGRKPKSATNGKGQRRGCNCKRSGCLKNYCECYESKTPCTINCKCLGCRNTEDRKDDIGLMFDQRHQTKVPVDNQHYMTNNMRNRSTTQSSQQLVPRNVRAVEKQEYLDEPVNPAELVATPAATLDAEATAHAVTCMLQVAAECNSLNINEEITEFLIIKQLGETLVYLQNRVDIQQSQETIFYDQSQIM